jgi:cell division protein FtsN
MGKINRYDKTKFITTVVLSVLLVVSVLYAADPRTEFELFDQGYKDYLSYHPEKAAEEFSTFLKEFPHSSASDAVMFWLGKSLTQLKSFDEAKRIFADIKQQFPDSPFVKYADKELDAMKRVSAFAGVVPETGRETKIADNTSLKTAGAEDQAGILKKEIQKATEQKKESKSASLQKEISKKAETPVQPATAMAGGKPSPPAAALGQKVIYSVQVGVFKGQRKANVLGAQLKREGYTVKVRKGSLHGKEVFKVLVGKFEGKSEAEAIAGKLKRTYRINTMVTASETVEEVQIAKAERLKEAGDSDKLRSLPAVSGVNAAGVETPQSPIISKKGVIYSVQIGVFSKQKTTDKLRYEFEKEGYPVKIIKGTSRGRDVFKVLVGQFADKNEAKSVARMLEKRHGENTIVSMSEAREEMPAERVEFVKAFQGKTKPGSSSAPAEKETVKITATATQTGVKDFKPKDVQAKPQSQQTSEEISKHAVASKDEKEHINVTAESSKAEKKQTGAVPAEKKKDNVTAVAAQTVSKGPEPKVVALGHPEQAKSTDKAGKNAEVLKTEKKMLSAPIQPVGPEKPKEVAAAEKPLSAHLAATEKETRVKVGKTEDEKKNVKSDAVVSGPPPVEIKDIKYTTRDVPKYTAASRSLCEKLQIKQVLWRTGNDNEDFLNEQALYDEARNLHITTDKNKLTEMIENYQLDDKEADYLQRYLAISSLIERKIRDMPEEKVVESLVVRYDENDRHMEIVLCSDLQNLARKGTPFEEIYRLYPDIVKFSVTGFQELEKRMKEKVQPLRDNEIVVTWSENGYMILKPIFRGPVFRPFGDTSPALRDRMKTYILAWTKGLREKYSAESGKEKK